MTTRQTGLTIRVKLLIIFFLMAVIPLIMTGVVYYLNLGEMANILMRGGTAFQTRTSLAEIAHQMSINMLIKVLGMAGIIAIFAFYFINRLYHSVRRVVEGAEKVSSGDLEYRIEVRSNDEMRALADSFNHMAAEVKKMMESIAEREHVQRELEVARIIQMTILPDHVPPYSNVAIATHWQPATEVGGDYYDLISISERTLGIAIGDVSGHGVVAGILASMAKSCLFTQVNRCAGAEEVMSAMNTMVYEVFKKKLLMTFLYSVLDIEKKELTLANAGHLPPYHFCVASNELREIENSAYPLGVRKNLQYKALRTPFAAGDSLILYSDGIVEAANGAGEQFDFDRFESVLRTYGAGPPEELKAHVLGVLDEFCEGQPRMDDTTLIVVKLQ